MNSLPKAVTRQRRGCDLNPGRSAPESSTLIAKFHYTDTDTAKLRAGPCGSVRVRVRVRVVEFSYSRSATEPRTYR